MQGRSVPTRVTTALFLDIVRSTEIAAELGDVRWRDVLARFRRIVRHDLRRFHGREQDTAGDAFFATFDQPAAAIRCADAVVRDVQTIGLDVRCGVHVGEVAQLEGRPGGVAVHAASRVMGLAGPAEILCTTTVRDLVLGSEMTFDPRGVHELKGVPGAWEILAVRGAATPLPPPLDGATAGERRRTVPAKASASRRWVLVGGLAAILTVVAVNSRSGTEDAPGAPPSPPGMVAIDPDTNGIVKMVGERPDAENVVYGSPGSLWQSIGRKTLIRRSPADGEELARFDADLHYVPTFGFGDAWTYSAPASSARTPVLDVTRYEAASPDVHRSFPIPGQPFSGNAFNAFVAGPSGPGQGVWYVSLMDTKLRRIDPISNKTTAWSTGGWGLSVVGPNEVLPTRDTVWLCDSTAGLIKRFDIRTHTVSKPVNVHRGSGCPVAVVGTSLWVLDRENMSMMEYDTVTLEQKGPARGVGGSTGVTSIGRTEEGFGALWLPEGRSVIRFDLRTRQAREIPMPTDVSAGTIAVDEPSNRVWVGNCTTDWCGWVPA